MPAKYLATSRGYRIAYRQHEADGGTGVVFLGGFRSDMAGTKAEFLHRHCMLGDIPFLRLDYSGHGLSDNRFEDGCISVWAEDAREAILSLTDAPQVIVGSSMGGWIALLFARSHPSRVAGLVGIAPAPDFTEGMRDEIESDGKWEELVENGYIEVESEYSDDPLRLTHKLLLDGGSNLIFNEPLTVDAPVRLLHGAADIDVLPTVSTRLLEHMASPDARCTLVKGVDHRFSSESCLGLIAGTVDDLVLRARPRSAA